VKDDGVYLRHVLRCIARIEEYTAVGREGGIDESSVTVDTRSSSSLGGRFKRIYD